MCREAKGANKKRRVCIKKAKKETAAAAVGPAATVSRRFCNVRTKISQ